VTPLIPTQATALYVMLKVDMLVSEMDYAQSSKLKIVRLEPQTVPFPNVFFANLATSLKTFLDLAKKSVLKLKIVGDMILMLNARLVKRTFFWRIMFVRPLRLQLQIVLCMGRTEKRLFAKLVLMDIT
jgi:hypothetical protein